MPVGVKSHNVKIIVLGFLLVLSGSVQAAVDLVPLKLSMALPIVGPDDFQPSGLTICDNRLLVVSDRHSDAVYELVEEEGRYAAGIYRQLSFSSPDPEVPMSFSQHLKSFVEQLILGKRYDWEGITCDETGTLYLVSESFSSIARVGGDGSVEWVAAEVMPISQAAGMLAKHNAGFEGISWYQRDLYLVAEREPRGVVKLSPGESGWNISARVDNEKQLQNAVAPHRNEDFSGLYSYEGKLFTLERNASAICQRDDMFVLVHCWSYRHIEESSEYGFDDNRYGIAEGIAMDDKWIYLVLDNNGDSRRANSEDVRPLLYRLAKPLALN